MESSVIICPLCTAKTHSGCIFLSPTDGICGLCQRWTGNTHTKPCPGCSVENHVCLYCRKQLEDGDFYVNTIDEFSFARLATLEGLRVLCRPGDFRSEERHTINNGRINRVKMARENSLLLIGLRMPWKVSLLKK
jgi:hypothetical protein